MEENVKNNSSKESLLQESTNGHHFRLLYHLQRGISLGTQFVA